MTCILVQRALEMTSLMSKLCAQGNTSLTPMSKSLSQMKGNQLLMYKHMAFAKYVINLSIMTSVKFFYNIYNHNFKLITSS